MSMNGDGPRPDPLRTARAVVHWLPIGIACWLVIALVVILLWR